jgi:hypothetical protein
MIHIAADRPTVFAHACRLGAEGMVSKKVDGTSIRPAPRLARSRSAIPPASPGTGSGGRIGMAEHQAAPAPPQRRNHVGVAIEKISDQTGSSANVTVAPSPKLGAAPSA